MKRSMINNYSLFISIFLLAEGIWGMYSDVVFKLLTTNRIHATIHITLGITGILLGLRHKARPYCIFIGILLPLIGILHFIPATSGFVTQLLNANDLVGVMNIIVGVLALMVAYVGKRDSYAKESPVNDL